MQFARRACTFWQGSIFRLSPGRVGGLASGYDQTNMRASRLIVIALLSMSTLAFGQAEQSTAAQQKAVQAPTSQSSASPKTNDKCPCKPWTVVDSANTSKQLKESQPPSKVYTNKDVKDPASADATAAANSGAAPSGTVQMVQTAKTQPAVPNAGDVPVQTPAAFKAQGDAYKNQILLEKQKVAAIKNHVTNLKYQFDSWATSFAQDGGAESCWTVEYYSYKDWCDTGRNLKAQYDAAQGQLKQEKANLRKMQEAIRRKGYGNAVYDPD